MLEPVGTGSGGTSVGKMIPATEDTVEALGVRIVDEATLAESRLARLEACDEGSMTGLLGALGPVGLEF